MNWCSDGRQQAAYGFVAVQQRQAFTDGQCVDRQFQRLRDGSVKGVEDFDYLFPTTRTLFQYYCGQPTNAFLSTGKSVVTQEVPVTG